ncbi:hypothetical protein ABE583_18975, partial [Stenotrophomonas sp. TWI143]|uniref:hypothetical protein n=1 Tax=Stenotrophomonas sp. TWI143 TaxID=3136771 RepID=UPI00320A8AB9
PTAIEAARENAEVAGVAHAIRFTRADVSELTSPEQEIHGSDIDPTAIEAARENAEVAGVAHAIRFTRADVSEL